MVSGPGMPCCGIPHGPIFLFPPTDETDHFTHRTLTWLVSISRPPEKQAPKQYWRHITFVLQWTSCRISRATYGLSVPFFFTGDDENNKMVQVSASPLYTLAGVAEGLAVAKPIPAEKGKGGLLQVGVGHGRISLQVISRTAALPSSPRLSPALRSTLPLHSWAFIQRAPAELAPTTCSYVVEITYVAGA